MMRVCMSQKRPPRLQKQKITGTMPIRLIISCPSHLISSHLVPSERDIRIPKTNKSKKANVSRSSPAQCVCQYNTTKVITRRTYTSCSMSSWSNRKAIGKAASKCISISMYICNCTEMMIECETCDKTRRQRNAKRSTCV